MALSTSTTLRYATATTLVVVAMLWSVAAGGPPAATRRSASQPQGVRSLPDIALSTVDGKRIRPADRKGRPMVLAFVREHQTLSERVLTDLQAEYDALGQNGVDVLAVVSGDSPPARWQDLSVRLKLTFPLAVDAEGKLQKAVGSAVRPVTLITDRDARVVSRIFLHRASFRRDLWRRVRRTEAPEAEAARRQMAAAEARATATRDVCALVRAGQVDEAVEAMARVRSQSPDRFAIRMFLGRALLALNRPEEATKEFLAAGKLDAHALRARFWLGIGDVRSGNEQKGRALLRESAGFMPDAWRAQGELGILALQHGAVDEAVSHLRKSVDIGTDRIWRSGGAWVGTKAPVVDVLDLDGKPGQPTVSRSKPLPAVVLFWMTGHGDAARCLQALQDHYTQLGPKHLMIAAINVDRRRFSAGDRAGVRRAVQAAGVSFPVWLDADLESFARYDVGAVPTWVLIDRAGKVTARIAGADLPALAEALPALVASAGDPPPSTTAPVRPPASAADRYIAMGRHLARQGNIASAIDSLRRALAEVPGRGDASALLARLLCTQDRADEATALLADAARSNPVSPRLATVYGDCLVRTGRSADAIQIYQRVLEEQPAYAPAQVGLGRALAATGKAKAALPALQRAVRLNPHDERALISLAEVLQSIGRRREAAEALQHAYRMRWLRVDILERH